MELRACYFMEMGVGVGTVPWRLLPLGTTLDHQPFGCSLLVTELVTATAGAKPHHLTVNKPTVVFSR